MTYSEIKRNVLELIDRYSVAGEPVSLAYNNQSDYIQRIPNLINGALTQIHLRAHPVAMKNDCPPDTLLMDAQDFHELDAPYPWIQAACYYAAAYLVMDDDPFRYQALMNEYETFLARISGRVWAEQGVTEDVYGFNAFDGM